MRHLSIRQAAPNIFRRPPIFISPSDPVIQAATYLAIGPQIYVDGLAVLQEERLAGRIGGYLLVKHILHMGKRWLEYKVADIMDPLESPLQDTDLVGSVLDFFAETRFAFAPIAVGSRVVASLSIRDLLGVAEKTQKIVDEIASPVMVIKSKASVVDALEMMVYKSVRNLIFMEQDGPHIINDRKVLEYLLAHEARTLMEDGGLGALAGIELKSLGPIKGIQVDAGSSAGSIAPMLSDPSVPCLFVGKKILTPWDIVMKGSGFMG